VSLRARLARRARSALRRLGNGGAGYRWLPAPSVERQRIRFRFLEQPLEVSSGYATPLYETVAEVVDHDCYQLRGLARALGGCVLLDVGANVGVTALCLSRIPGARVVCFEPVPETCAELRANLDHNGAANVAVVEAALGPRNGRARLWVPAHESVGARLWEEGTEPSGRFIEVRTLDLATALAEAGGRVGLMKLDCEGGEHDLIAQLTPQLAARLPRLSLEVHDRGEGRDLRSLGRRLQELGYRLNHRPDVFGRAGLDHLLAERAA
jgi:FkbM family methyltransferase